MLAQEMLYSDFYNTMPDGTIKQINPFTKTEVWSVPGRSSKPITNDIPANAEKIEKKAEEDYCSFCRKRYSETPPEKSRLIFEDGSFKILTNLFPSSYNDSVPIFRRVPNLFEIVTIDYWRKNYDYKLSETKRKWKETFLNEPSGLKHVIDVLNYKLRVSGKSDEEIDKISMEEKFLLGDAFFGGGHELIIANRHYPEYAEWDSQLFSSGMMSTEEHFQYFKFTIEAMKDIIAHNRYIRYISIFQNWLKQAGASFDHLHKQLVALDEWGSRIEMQIEELKKNPNAFNDFGANFASMKNLLIAENDHAIACVGIGHRYPTIEIYSKSNHCRPYEHTDEELRGVSDLVHSCHVAMGNQISCNEEWYYTPIDAVNKMPWHIFIRWRINTPAGFEGGTNIYINPLRPVELRDKMVPRLYKARDEKTIFNIRIAEECRVTPNPLKYYY
jgi:galactose-1-phosphate uridylyltransferase